MNGIMSNEKKEMQNLLQFLIKMSKLFPMNISKKKKVCSFHLKSSREETFQQQQMKRPFHPPQHTLPNLQHQQTSKMQFLLVLNLLEIKLKRGRKIHLRPIKIIKHRSINT